MKIAILSDIHANYPALTKVVEHAKRHGAEQFWCLGDVIGYGPYAVECLHWLTNEVAELCWVMGNHEAMFIALMIKNNWFGDPGQQSQVKEQHYYAFRELAEAEGKEGLFSQSEPKITVGKNEPQSGGREGTPRDPIAALNQNIEALKTCAELGSYGWQFFTKSRLGPSQIIRDGTDYWLVHASRLDNRQIGPYIYPWASYYLEIELNELQKLYQVQNRPICQFHGHTHVPYLLTTDSPIVEPPFHTVCVESGKVYPLGKCLTLANPGSVGQPRNTDCRACYALLDTSLPSLTFYRVKYDVDKVIRTMTRMGFPNHLAWRLHSAAYGVKEHEPPDEWKSCYECQKQEEEVE